jgi:hypothetical protein
VLRVYGDVLLAAPIDRKEHRIKPEFRELTLLGQTVHRERVGPLVAR